MVICSTTNLFHRLFPKMLGMNSICRKSLVYTQRIPVPDDKVGWDISWPEYLPQYFTAEHLKDCAWADPEINDPKFKPVWNAQHGVIDRRSYNCDHQRDYDIVDGYPLNPIGRTGLRGRGRLGRWGPNHAGDALVTRWKRNADKSKVIDPQTNAPMVQFLAIKRKDCGKWAIPGGFVNPNEEPCAAVLRELFEEAVNLDELSVEDKNLINAFTGEGKKVYKGYMDDPRNTDNAWIETTVYNFYDETGEITEKMALEARDDAADVKWVDIVEDMDIYETHRKIVDTAHNMNFGLFINKDW